MEGDKILQTFIPGNKYLKSEIGLYNFKIYEHRIH